MKKILLTLAALAVMVAANAQFYNTGSASFSGRFNVYAGGVFPSSDITFQEEIYTPATYGGYYYSKVDVEADELTFKPGFSFAVALNSLNDKTDNFKFGWVMDLAFSTFQYEAIFKHTATYTFNTKASSFAMALGASGEVLFAEKVGIAFDVAPYFDILFGQKVRSERTGSDPIDWHDVGKSDMSMPLIDFGLLARFGANYHFSDNMWAGLSLQYRLPFFCFGGSDFKDEQVRNLDYNFSVYNTKRKGVALLLTWGFDM